MVFWSLKPALRAFRGEQCPRAVLLVLAAREQNAAARAPRNLLRRFPFQHHEALPAAARVRAPPERALDVG